MSNYIVILLCILLSFNVGSSQDFVSQEKDSTAIFFANTITAHDLKKHLYVLCSDSLEGRETGEPGQKKAAIYMKDFFERELNIQPLSQLSEGYFQKFPLTIKYPVGGELKVGEKQFSYKKDFYYLKVNSEANIVASEMVYLGYGIDDESYSDYKNMTVTGKVAVIHSGVPNILHNNKRAALWVSNWRAKLDVATKRGLKALLIIDDDLEQNLVKQKHFIESPYVKLSTDTLDFCLYFIFHQTLHKNY